MVIKPVCLAFAAIIVMVESSFADSNVELGEKVFQRCISCHIVIDHTNKKGPTLRGIVGRPAASVSGFEYSDGLKAFGASGAIWDEATLDKFLQDTIGFVRGMRMAITPVRRETERAALIAFLKSNK
jgi:cytochrome c